MTTTDLPTVADSDETAPASGVLQSPWFALAAFWVALALLPVVLLTPVPFAAWALAVGIWLVNRFAAIGIARVALELPKHLAVGAAGLAMMFRVWLSAGVFFFVSADIDAGSISVGLGRPDIGVPAILLFMLIFTVDIVVRALFQMAAGQTKDEGVADDAER